MPGRMPTPAVTHAGNVTNEHLLGAEPVAARAVSWRLGDPLASPRDQIADGHAATIDPANDETAPTRVGAVRLCANVRGATGSSLERPRWWERWNRR